MPDRLRDAGAGVTHLHRDLSLHDLRAEAEAPALGHGVHRVQHQVGEGLAQLGGIARDLGQVLGQVGLDLDLDPAPARVLPPHRLGGLEDLLQDLVQVDRDRGLVAPDPGEVLEAAHGARAVHGRALDDLQPPPQLHVLDALQQELGPPQDRREHVVEVVGHPGGHLSQGAELLGAHQLVLGRGQIAERAAALLVEPGAAQHEGGEVRDVDDQPLVGLGERAVGAAQGEHAQHPVARGHGHDQAVRHPDRGRHRSDAVARAIRHVVGGAERPGGVEHHPGEPGLPARVEVRLLLVAALPVAHSQDDAQDVLLLVVEHHRHAAHLEHAGDLLVDGVEQAGLVELAGDRAGKLVQDGQLLYPPVVLLEQARVLQGHAGLARDRLHEPELRLAQVAGRGQPPGDEAADQLLLGHDGYEQHGAERRRAPERGRHARIVRRVGGEHRLPPPRRLPEERVVGEADPHLTERGQAVRRHVVPREGHHRLPIVLQEPQSPGVGAQAVRDVAQELATEGLDVEGGREGLAHRQQGLGLLQLLGGLTGQLRVLHPEPDLGRHALHQPHLRLAELAAGLPPHQEDRAHRLAPHGGGGEEHRVGRDPLQGLGVEARVGVRVAARGGAAVAPHLAEVREAREHEGPRDEALPQLRGHLVAGQRHQRVALAVERVDAHHVRPERVAHRAGHRAHHVAGRVGPGERVADREQRGGLAQALLHLGVEAGVGEGQRELARDGHREVHLPGLDLDHAVHVVEQHDPDHLVLADQGHRHRGLDPEGRDPLRRDQIARRRVLHHHRAAGLHRAGVQRRIERQGAGHAPVLLPAGGVLPAVGELGHEGDHPAVLPALDRAAVHLAELRDLHGDFAKQAPRIEGGVQDLRDLQQRAALLEAAARLAVEARVANGHAGLGHEAVEDLLVVGPETDRAAAVQAQHALQRVLGDDRHREEARELVPRGPLLAREARVLLHVRDLEGRAVEGRPARRAPPEAHLVVREPEPQRIRDGSDGETLGRLVHHVEDRERHSDQLHRRRRDRLQHLVHVERRGHHVREVGQAAEPRRALLERLVQARILQRGGDLVGEDREVLDLPVGEARAARAVRDEGPLHVLADERHRQDRPPPDLLDPPARVLAQLDPRIGQHVRGPHRAALEQRAAHHPLVHPEGPRPLGEGPRVLPLPHREAQVLGPPVLQPDGEVGHGQRLAGLGRDQLQHAGLVERGDQHAAELGHRPHARGLLRGLVIEARVVDGDGGLAREGLGELLLAGGERPPPAEHEHPDGPLADQQRHPEEVGVAEATARREVVGQHLRALELAHQGVPGGQHPAAQALAGPDPRADHGLGRGAEHAGHHEVLAVEQAEPRVVDLEEPGRFFRDGGEQGLRRGEGADLLVDLEQRGERGLAVALLREQARVVEGHRGLARQRAHDRDLALGRGVGLPPVRGQRAEHLALADQGHRQHRAVSLALDGGPGGRAERHLGIVQDVGAPHRAALLGGPAGGALPEPHPQRAQEPLGEPAPPLVGQEAGGRVEARDAEGRDPQQGLTAIHHQVEDAVDLEGRAHHSADLEQSLVLGRVAGGLVEEARVLERHRGLGGEVGEGREVLVGERGRAGRAARGHHAQGAPARHQRPGEQAAREGHELGHRVRRRRVVVDHEPASALHGGAGDSRAHVEAQVADPVADIGPRARAEQVALQHVERGVTAPDQALGRAGDHHQQLLGVELLGDVPLDHPLRLEAAQAGRGHVAQAGALHRETHLLSHTGEDPHLLAGELARLLGDERHHAPGLLLDRDRHRELGAVGSLRRHLAQTLLGGRHRVQVGHEDLVAADRVADAGALHRTHPRGLHVPGIEAAARDHDQLAARRVELVHAAHVHPGEAAHHLEGLARGGFEVGAPPDGGGDGVEGLQLPVAPLQHDARVLHPRPGGGRARPARRGQERQHHPAQHDRSRREQGQELVAEPALGGRELLHRQRHPERAVGRLQRLAREPAQRPRLPRDGGDARAGRRRPAGGRQVPAARAERAIPGQEDHRGMGGQPIERGPEALEAPSRRDRPGGAEGRALGGAVDRGHDQEVGPAAGQAERGDRLGRGRRARQAGRRAGGHLHERRAALVADHHEVGETVLGDREHAGRRAPRESRPVSPRDALDHRGVARQQEGFPPERLLVVGNEDGDRVHRARDGVVARATELPGGAHVAERGQDPERDGEQQERDDDTPGEAAHVPILGPQPAK